jgi:hypothetical protein
MKVSPIAARLASSQDRSLPAGRLAIPPACTHIRKLDRDLSWPAVSVSARKRRDVPDSLQRWQLATPKFVHDAKSAYPCPASRSIIKATLAISSSN